MQKVNVHITVLTQTVAPQDGLSMKRRKVSELFEREGPEMKKTAKILTEESKEEEHED